MIHESVQLIVLPIAPKTLLLVAAIWGHNTISIEWCPLEAAHNSETVSVVCFNSLAFCFDITCGLLSSTDAGLSVQVRGGLKGMWINTIGLIFHILKRDGKGDILNMASLGPAYKDIYVMLQPILISFTFFYIKTFNKSCNHDTGVTEYYRFSRENNLYTVLYEYSRQ